MLFSKLGRYRYSPNLYCDIPKIMFILFSNIFTSYFYYFDVFLQILYALFPDPTGQQHAEWYYPWVGQEAEAWPADPSQVQDWRLPPETGEHTGLSHGLAPLFVK